MHGVTTSDNADSPENDQNEVEYCKIGCKFDRKEKKSGRQLEMIRCSFCLHWYHNECMGLRNDANPEIWPCTSCCMLFNDIADIKNRLDGTMKHLQESLERANRDIDQRKLDLKEANKNCDSMRSECRKLHDEMNTMRIRIAELERDIKHKTWQTFRNKQSMLIGDSLIRDIDENKLVKTVVKSVPGAKVAEIQSEFQEAACGVDQLSKIFICAGTNDCTSMECDIAAVTTTYEAMIGEMLKNVDKPSDVIVSSVPPRNDKDECQKRVDALNTALCDMSRRVGAHFINNDLSFRLANGDVNDGYLLPSDGLHLTKQGTNKLAKNIGLVAKSNNNLDVTKPWKKSRQKPRPKSQNIQEHTNAGQTLHNHDDCNEEEDDLNDEPWKVYQSRKQWSSRRFPSNDAHKDNRGEWQGDHHGHHHRMSHREERRGNFRRSSNDAPRGAGFRNQHHHSERCGYCAEHNHSTRECGFRKPAVCRQCSSKGHKQKFCSEFIAVR